MAELPEERSKTVEAGLAVFHRAQEDLAQLRAQLEEARIQIAERDVQIHSFDQLQSMLESRVAQYQAERDQAVADRAVFEALFVSITAQLQAFKIPNGSLVVAPMEALLPQIEHGSNGNAGSQDGG